VTFTIRYHDQFLLQAAVTWIVLVNEKKRTKKAIIDYNFRETNVKKSEAVVVYN
jgi:hypothetical protein